MIIQHNLPGMNSRRVYKKNNSSLSKSLEKLSSGYRINRAGDDAAGLAVSEKMRSQIAGMKQAVVNSQDGISLIQTFEGALGETVAIIHRMKTLADQSANGSYSDEVDRQAIEVEFLHLCDEVNQIADTDFNGICMINGGAMADGITYLTDKGRWKLPDTLIFDEDSYVSTFKKIEGFPEIKMSIKLADDVKGITEDRELWKGIMALNGAKVRGNFINGIPVYSLTGLDDAWADKFTVTSSGYSGVISLTTEKSGTVEVGYIESTEFPHYASTSALGGWTSGIVVDLYGSSPTTSLMSDLAGLKIANPGWTDANLTKYTSTYVCGTSATHAERQAYLDWIKAAGTCTAEIVDPDPVYDHDGDPNKFVWSVDNKTYTEPTDAELSTNPLYLGIYGSSYTGGGPQLYVKNVQFQYDDEDMLVDSTHVRDPYYSVGTSTSSFSISASWYTGSVYKSAVGCTSRTTVNESRWLNYWLDYGNVSISYKYDGIINGSKKWTATITDSTGKVVKTETDTESNWGISRRVYNYTAQEIAKDSYKKQQDAKNLYHYEENGDLPVGFELLSTISAPRYRTQGENGYVFSESVRHTDYYDSTYNGYDLKLEEIDEEHPELGGVDWKVAQHGEKYRYDGVNEYWVRLSDNAVINNLEDEGIYLPDKLYWRYELHDGMQITVSNPTMSGEDWIEAELDNGIRERLKVSIPNYYRNDNSKLTFSDNLIIQAGARAKDGVRFTFAYSAGGIGDLYPDLDCTIKGLGLDSLSLSTQEKANYAIDRIDHALNKVSMVRSSFGAIQNRLEHKIDNLNNGVENLTSAESGIRDTDVAEEIMKFTKDKILSQASQAMLAQANSLPQSVLSLISG